MRNWRQRLLRLLRITALGLVVLLLLAGAGLVYVTRSQAHTLVNNPLTRSGPDMTPPDFDLPYTDVTVTSADGFKLVGWYIPTENGAVVIAQHGYKSNRGEMLNEAELLHRHGYGVLVTSVRAHDGSDGTLITFGYNEMKDLEAWYQYLLQQPQVNPERIGELGNSMGGSLVIQYAAQNPKIKAVVANSPFSSLNDTVNTSVTYFTGLPPFPFAPMIQYWAEQETGLKSAEIDAKLWIKTLSPRPVLLMQGGKDIIVEPGSGQRLYAAAGEPKELWFDPALGHTDFDRKRPKEYERRVVAFFDKYLLGK